MNSKIMITLIACCLIIYQGYTTMNSYKTKAEMQIIENNGVVELRGTWNTLEPDIEKWNNTFPIDNEVRDLNGVYQAIDIERHNLKSQNLMLNDAGREIIKVNEEIIGLSKTCLTNSNQGFVLKNEFVSIYNAQLKGLLERSDIEFGSISMRVDPNLDFRTPYVTFDSLCVVMRGSDTFLEGIF